MEDTDYKVRLEIFEGPLDLLLYLIKKEEIDIYNVSLERITRQYLDYIDTFKALTPEQWERTGIHPERGLFTMTDAALQVVSHDCDHTEQITRILLQR